jgi:Zn-dependent protease with chaperone function
MSDFPDSGVSRPSADAGPPNAPLPSDTSNTSGPVADETLQTALQRGLAALKQQDYRTAIAQLEACQNSQEGSLRLKAQMGLIKAYARTNQVKMAVELCRPLCQHPNPQVQRWAEQTYRELAPESPEVEPAQIDSTGFQPLAAPVKAGSVPAPDSAASVTRQPAQPQVTQSQVAPSQAAPPQAAPPQTGPPQTAQPNRQSAPPCPVPAFQNGQLDWQNAGRSTRWTSLGRVDASGLWALQAGSLVLLFWLSKLLVETLFRVWNSLTVWLSQLIDLPRLLLPESVGLPLLVLLLILGLASPWLLRLILQRAYGLRPFSLAQLERSSPESTRLLKRVTQQQMPQLELLPTHAPLLFSFGYLPQQARLVISQGLLDQLQADEIATLMAAELAHIRYWDFGPMTVIVLVCQLPYLLYWQAAQLGDRWPNPLLRILTTIVSSASYGLFWWLRLAGLWLSRVRLYYSDRLAADLTGNPNGLARALLKLAMGTASEIQDQKATLPLLEGFELLAPVGYRSALTGSLYNGDLGLFNWDRANPDRRWLLLNNSHPLLGERLDLLMQYGQQWRLEPELRLNQLGRPVANWGRLALQGAPFWGIPIGVGTGLLLWGLGWLARQWRWFELSWLIEDRSLLLACALLGFGIGMFLRINAYYPDIKRSNLQPNPDLNPLLSRPDALPLDSQPVQFKGVLLGRPGLQNWLHRDLTLQTPTGLIRLHYTSQLGWIGDLFPQAIRPTALLNRTVTVTGWFRRGATPWIDVETIQSEYGRILRSYHPIWSTVLASAAVLLAIWLILRGDN